MVNEVVAIRISKHLKQLYSKSKNGKNGWLKLEVIESETDVSRQTLSRILNGKANKLYYRTAMNLADYIEKETQGKVSADYLLTESQKNYVGADLRGANFSGEDLTHFNFAQADLTGANFEGAKLDYSDFTSARLKDANFSSVTGTGTNFTAAVATGATFKNFQARFLGYDWIANESWRNVIRVYKSQHAWRKYARRKDQSDGMAGRWFSLSWVTFALRY